MEHLYNLIDKVIDTDVTILVQGESGTGKELIAKAIHEKSERHDGPFVRFNCAAIPETLLENELFGHEKGSYTGADQTQLGRFELAQNGTLFIDEIGELSLSLQVKLLRALQEKEIERLGSSETIKINTRIVTATNKDLKIMVEQKQFRDRRHGVTLTNLTFQPVPKIGAQEGRPWLTYQQRSVAFTYKPLVKSLSLGRLTTSFPAL